VAAHGREDGNGANEVDSGNLPKGLVQRYVEVSTNRKAPAPGVSGLHFSWDILLLATGRHEVLQNAWGGLWFVYTPVIIL
jgi:hypothetical protein